MTNLERKVVDLIGVRVARALGVLKPCLPSRTLSDLALLGYDEVAKLAGSISFHIVDAAVCIEDHVFSSHGNSQCPTCGTSCWTYLTDLKVQPVNPSPLWDEERKLRRDWLPT